MLNASSETNANYWMRVHGLDFCARVKSHQEAILRYQGALDEDPQQPGDYESGDRGGVVSIAVYLKELCTLLNFNLKNLFFPNCRVNIQ